MTEATINSILVMISALAGYGVSTFQEIWRARKHEKNEKWKYLQQRIDNQLEQRKKAYSKGLKFVFDVQISQGNQIEFDDVLTQWKFWYPLNAINFPPSVNDALFSAMSWAFPVYVDLCNRQSNSETQSKFHESVKEAKKLLLNQTDIDWLPEGLR